MNEVEDAEVSRRHVVRAAGAIVAGGAAAVLSACGTRRAGSSTEAVLSSAAQRNVELLGAALDVEHRAIAAYTAAVPLLAGRERAAAKAFLAQELSHAALLTTLIRRAGGQPHPQRSNYDLGRPRGRRGLLRLLQSLEQAQLSAYLPAAAQVTPGSARAAVAMMLAADAQHLSVLNLELHVDPIPAAFLTAGASTHAIA